MLLGDLNNELRPAIRHKGSHVPCLMHNGTHGDGFRLFPDADVTGGGYCNTCGAFGDGIKLLRKINGWGFHQTLDVIEKWLVENGDSTGAQAVDNRAYYTGTSNQVPVPDPYVVECINVIRHAAVMNHPRGIRYLQSRGLSGVVPRNLGYIEELHYRDETIDAYLPALVTFLQAPDNIIVGVHRTYLDLHGDGKAHVKTPKKFSKALYPGALNGSAIRLHKHTGVIAITEGVETALAVQQVTRTPAWAAGTAGLLQEFLPPKGIRQVDIWADNDKNGTGQRAAIKLAFKLIEFGYYTRLMIPPDEGTDWLDVLVTNGDERLQEYHKQAWLMDPGNPIAKIILYNLLLTNTEKKQSTLLSMLLEKDPTEKVDNNKPQQGDRRPFKFTKRWQQHREKILDSSKGAEI